MFIVEEMMPWNTSLQLWKNIPHWHANPWSYWIGVCEHFYANKSVIDWIRSQHFDVAVVDLIQGGQSGLDPDIHHSYLHNSAIAPASKVHG